MKRRLPALEPGSVKRGYRVHRTTKGAPAGHLLAWAVRIK